MHVSSVRWGFANNSSSSHSIVLDSSLKEFGAGDDSFGWENFLLKTPDSKMRYMAAQLYENLRYKVGAVAALATVKGLMGVELSEDAGVDHQSQFTLPCKASYEGVHVDLDFFNDLTKYIVNNPKVAVAGGNDNQDAYEYGGTTDNRFRDFTETSELLCRKDQRHWVLFNRSTGQKARLSFVTDEPYTSASLPEAVDLKITDYCPFGCAFCYQGSTIGGQHATKDEVFSVLSVLSQMNVFEVALGGGETTMHPHFADILNYADLHHLRANFTTFWMGWTKNPPVDEAVRHHSKSFALSVNSKTKSEEWRLLDELALWRSSNTSHQTSVQSVLELNTLYWYEMLVTRMQDNRLSDLTLLGHKSWGRGGAKPDGTDWTGVLSKIIDLCKSNRIRLAVDTSIVDSYRSALDAAGISPVLTVDREGAFTMYVDAVTQTVAKDSYNGGQISYVKETKWGRQSNLTEVVGKHFPFTGRKSLV